MGANLMPGRRDFLGISSSAALAVAMSGGVAGGMSGCSRAARAATATARDASPGATLAAAGKLFRAGHFAQADALYEQVLAGDPGNPDALAARGYVAMLGNRLQQARTLLQRALRAQPGNQQAAQNLAATLYRLNDFPAAAAAYRRLGGPSALMATAPMAQMLAGFGATAPYQIYGPDATRLPFLRTSPLPMVSITVNGSAPIPVHLDTGAPTLVIDQSYAPGLGLRQVAPGWARADRITLGGIEVRNVPVSLGLPRLTSLRAPDGQPDHGIIGTGLLNQFLFTMDYAGAALELRRPGPARPGQADDAGAATMPFWMAGDHFMLTWGSINGRSPRLLVIDTGGTNIGLVLSVAQAAADGITLDKKKARRVVAGIVNGKAQYRTGYPATVGSLALGTAVNCGFPGSALSPSPGAAFDSAFGLTTGGTVSHSFFLPFAATFDFSRMRLSLRGTAPSCGTGG